MNTVGSRELNLNVYDSIKYEDKYDYYKVLFAKRKKELEAFFKVSKRNRGIGFSIPMTSLIGMKLYQFLVDTL